MKLLVVQPGASWATSDVHEGLVAGFAALGHEIIHYQLDARIAASGGWLRYLHQQQREKNGPLAGTPPTPADVQYHAGVGLLERALRFEPDWVVVVSAMFLHPDVLILLRRAGVRLALIMTESPYDDGPQSQIVPLFDVCWTNERSSVVKFRGLCPQTDYLPVAYDPSRNVHALLPEVREWAEESDVCFVGTGFPERIEFLEAVDWTGIDLALYGEWSEVGKNSPLKRFVRGGMTTPEQTVALYDKTKIGLNLYRQSVGFAPNAPRIDHAESLNPRAYELAAARVFQISEPRAEVFEVFGGAVPTFKDTVEAEGLIRGFLIAPTHRRDLAQQAQSCVWNHTYAKRAAVVCDVLQARLEAVTPATFVSVAPQSRTTPVSPAPDQGVPHAV